VSTWQPVESWVLRNPVIRAQTSELFQAPQINTNKQYNVYTDKDFNLANKTSPTTLTYTKRIFQTSTVVYKTTIGVQPGHYCDQNTASKETVTLQSTFEALLFKESILQATTHELKGIPD
jgi:hypothetical protein